MSLYKLAETKKPDMTDRDREIADDVIAVFAKHNMTYVEALIFCESKVHAELNYRFSKEVLVKS
jgi:hypothetical protein